MKYTYQCAVRFDDLDSYGHVNNVTFAEYLQEARVAFAHEFLHGGGSRSWAENSSDGSIQEEGSVVVRQVIEYRAPVPLRSEPLDVVVWVTKMGNTSFECAYEVRDDDTVFATASTVLVAFDVAAQKPRPLSDVERETMSRFLEAAP